jgi:hypothetical protein
LVFYRLSRIIDASSVKSRLWDPLTLERVEGGRATTFHSGFGRMIAYTGLNVSASIVLVSNGITSLFFEYIKLRRATILATIEELNHDFKEDRKISTITVDFHGLARYVSRTHHRHFPRRPLNREEQAYGCARCLSLTRRCRYIAGTN